VVIVPWISVGPERAGASESAAACLLAGAGAATPTVPGAPDGRRERAAGARHVHASRPHDPRVPRRIPRSSSRSWCSSPRHLCWTWSSLMLRSCPPHRHDARSFGPTAPW